MPAVETPTDWMNLPDWDRYWSEVLADEFWTLANMETWSFEFTSLQYLRGLEQRAGQRVLLAGNGISPEPYGFAHAGGKKKVSGPFIGAVRDFLRAEPNC
jgi:hypothetical protein